MNGNAAVFMTFRRHRPSILDEEWDVVKTVLPAGWEQQAVLQGAMERGRVFTSAESLLRTLLFQVGKGYSLQRAASEAAAAGLPDVSDVALLKRLRRAQSWLRWICAALARQADWNPRADLRGRRAMAVDAMIVPRPSRLGAAGKFFFSLNVPEVSWDHVGLSRPGQGQESDVRTCPVEPGDLVLLERSLSRQDIVESFCARGIELIARIDESRLPLLKRTGEELRYLELLQSMGSPAGFHEVKVGLAGRSGVYEGRLCMIRKSHIAARRLVSTAKVRALEVGESAAYTDWVLVFTNLPREEFRTEEVLEWCRFRWQVESAFRRLRRLIRKSRFPKASSSTILPWLYGELLLALAEGELVRLSREKYPWGYSAG